MGLYRRDNSSNWQMCFFVDGQRLRMSAKTTSKRVAQKIYDKIKGQIAEGTFNNTPKPDMPFDELVDEFLETHSRVEKRSYKCDQSTAKVLKRYFGSRQIGKITPYDIKSWRKSRSTYVTIRGTRISKGTLNRELAFLKTMFNLAVEWGWLSENPASKVKKLKGENKRLRFLSQEEISRLLECSPPHLKPIIITAISTGMRKGEILQLRWQEVDFEHGFIHVVKSKNSESRDIPMSPFLMETLTGLKKIEDSGDHVFRFPNGRPVKSIQVSFTKACRDAELKDFRFHDLRHTAASLFASGGCDIITLQHLLGHNSISMTQRYAHLIPEKHHKTRQIMQDFWQDFGATFTATSPEEPHLKKYSKALSSKDFARAI